MKKASRDIKDFSDSELEEILKARAEKKKKSASDPEIVKPKQKKPNAYMLWCSEERKTISKEGIFSGKDILRILGMRWKKLSPEEKLHWQNIAEDFSEPEEENVKKEKKSVRKIKEEVVKRGKKKGNN